MSWLNPSPPFKGIHFQYSVVLTDSIINHLHSTIKYFQQRVKPPSNIEHNFEVILGYDKRNGDPLCATATVQIGTIKILTGN